MTFSILQHCLTIIKYFDINLVTDSIMCYKLFFFLNFTLYVLIADAERIPNSVTSLEAIQMTTTLMYMRWKRPVNYFILSNYDVQYSGDDDIEDFLITIDANSTHSKITLPPTDRKYRIYMYSIYTAIVSNPTTLDIEMKMISTYTPYEPDFVYEINADNRSITITWLPNMERNPGNAFFASYRKKGEIKYQDSIIETTLLTVSISNIYANQTYEFFVVSCYETRRTKSKIKVVQT